MLRIFQRPIGERSCQLPTANYILSPMGIVLIGYRGSGKTTVGRLLAERLGRPFVDSDELIVSRAGKTIAQIFATGGEEAFRDLESAVVAKVALLADHVIALGGGALGRPRNLAAVQAGGHKIFYLYCQPRELLRRIQADPTTTAGRPALSNLGGGIEEIEKILSHRQPHWRKVMHAEVDVTELTPPQIADVIAKVMDQT
jgi:shikimate kinase